LNHNLRDFFLSLDATKLAEFKERRRQEDLHLDFKLVGKNGSGDEVLSKDRESLAIALSGFANADGGVIVWGGECKRDDEGVDAVPVSFGVSSTMRIVFRPLDERASRMTFAISPLKRFVVTPSTFPRWTRNPKERCEVNET